MSYLANAFQRRQHRREGSDSTVSSYEVENDAGASASNSFNSSGAPNIPNVMIKDCQNVKIGEQNTNYFSYNNYFLNDKNNPAFTLSDKTLSSRKKLKYILRQSWFWAIVVLIILLCLIPNVLTQILWPKPPLVVIILRNQWAEIPQKPGMTQLSLPVENVIIAQTEGDVCTSRDNCTARVQQMLLHYDNASLPDIPYNFLIGDDGFVYEGRGFHFKGEIVENEFSSSFNDVGLIIAFIGTFDDVQPSEQQLETFTRFLLQSVNRDVIARDYTLMLQDQLTMSVPDSMGLLRELGTLAEFHNVQPVTNRAIWGAAEPRDPALVEKFTDVITDVRVSQSAYDEPCLGQIFGLQVFDFSAGLNDILENFLITPCGIVEGRGWDTKPDSDSLVIMIIGEMQREVLDNFLIDGTIFGKLSIDANIECDGCTL